MHTHCVFSVFFACWRWLRRICSQPPKLAGRLFNAKQHHALQFCHAVGKETAGFVLSWDWMFRLDQELSKLKMPSFEWSSHFYGDVWLSSDLISGSKHSNFPIRMCSNTACLLFFSLAAELESHRVWWGFIIKLTICPFPSKKLSRASFLSAHTDSHPKPSLLLLRNLKYLNCRIKPILAPSKQANK